MGFNQANKSKDARDYLKLQMPCVFCKKMFTFPSEATRQKLVKSDGKYICEHCEQKLLDDIDTLRKSEVKYLREIYEGKRRKGRAFLHCGSYFTEGDDVIVDPDRIHWSRSLEGTIKIVKKHSMKQKLEHICVITITSSEYAMTSAMFSMTEALGSSKDSRQRKKLRDAIRELNNKKQVTLKVNRLEKQTTVFLVRADSSPDLTGIVES